MKVRTCYFAAMLQLTPLKVLRLSVPTLLIFYSVSWSSMPNMQVRREVFGAPDAYLDIVFPASQDPAFTGVVVIGDTERKITGTQVQRGLNTIYEFQTEEGNFSGVLKPPVKGCEPVLQYRIERNGKIQKSGSLRAGFCQS